MGLPFSEWADFLSIASNMPSLADFDPSLWVITRICLKQQLVSLIDGGLQGRRWCLCSPNPELLRRYVQQTRIAHSSNM